MTRDGMRVRSRYTSRGHPSCTEDAHAARFRAHSRRGWRVVAVGETTAGARAPRVGRVAAGAWLAHLALVAVACALAWLSGVPQRTLVNYAHPVSPHVFASFWLHAWDAREYARIAAHGYALPASAAFWPLLPLLERLAAPLAGGNVALAGFVIANLCALAALA